MARAKKGSVSVGTDKGWLRLRWTHAGKSYALPLSLPDTETNRAIALGKARQIELEIELGTFDPSLKRYKPEKGQGDYREGRLTVVEAFRLFAEHKARSVGPSTQAKHKATLRYLEAHFPPGQPLEFVGMTDAENFIKKQLSLGLSSEQVKRRVEELIACWDWNNFAEGNPWRALKHDLKATPKQPPRPFTRTEVQHILTGFQTSQHYGRYYDFVAFCLGTGCRIGEAIALRWKHLNDDCSSAWIGESISRGHRKSTKTGKARTIPLSPKVQGMLLERRPEKLKPDDLVFSSPAGLAIDDHNFNRRAWKTVLETAGVKYRNPYTMRATFVSHALESGLAPSVVANLTGHNIQVLYEHYAGSVNSRPQLPEF
jgi:integrase